MSSALRICLGVLVLQSVAGGFAAEAAAPAPAAAPAAADHRIPLGVLDSQLACFDALIAKVPDVQQRTAAKALSDGFKDRRVDLQKVFNHDLFLDLRWEIDVEYQRLIAWFATPTVTVAVNAAHPPAEHPIELLRPDPSNKAEIQVALDVLDRQIQSLEERARSLPNAPRRSEELTHVAQIKEHRAQLGKDFTRERWDELTGALKKQGTKPIASGPVAGS